jgi:hypothetical protein
MESNSKENRIHCSKEARKLLKEQFPELPLRSRGKINVKGKGEMHTYWVNEEAGVKRPSELLRQMDSALLSGSSTHERRRALEAVEEGESDDFMSMSFRVDDEPRIVEALPESSSVPEDTPELTPVPLQRTAEPVPEQALAAQEEWAPYIVQKESPNVNPDESAKHSPNLLFL